MKIDFKRELKSLYLPAAKDFVIVKVPNLNYLMVDGEGDPNTAKSYSSALSALYSTSYTLKFFSKKELNRDYVVPPLEGLWWADDYDSFRSRKKNLWKWTMMIMVPDWLTKAHVKNALAAVATKNPETAVDRIRFESLSEGLCVQIMHIGSYDDEAPTLARLHDVFLPENGLIETGKHHEIYIGDPRKTAPEKLKTVLRQPVRKK